MRFPALAPSKSTRWIYPAPALSNSLAISISQNFTSSIIKIWIATGVTYGLSYGIGKGFEKWGLTF